MAKPPERLVYHYQVGPALAKIRNSGREALWRKPPRLRKFARKGLEPDDESQLHDLGLCKMLPHPSQALFGHL